MKISLLDPLTTGFSSTADMFPLVHAGKTWRVAPSDVIANYLSLTSSITIGGLAVTGSAIVGSLAIGTGTQNILAITPGPVAATDPITLMASSTSSGLSTNGPLFLQTNGASVATQFTMTNYFAPAGNVITGDLRGGTPATPANISGSNRPLLSLQGRGWGGGATTARAQINLATGSTWTTTSHATWIDFLVTPAASTVMASAMRLQASGQLSIGTTGQVGTHKLYVFGNMAVTGVTLLGLDPVNPLEAATKQYVDNHAPRLLTASWVAGVNPNNVSLGVLAQGGTVVSVSAVPEVVNGAAATVTPYWVASGALLSAGTALTIISFDTQGAAGTVQTLTLSGSVVIPPGGRIGLRTTGTFNTSVANVTVRVA